MTMKGLALSGLGRHEEAIKCYEEANRINPKMSLPGKEKVLLLVYWVTTMRLLKSLIRPLRSTKMMVKPGMVKASLRIQKFGSVALGH
jgi:hypothetical protein